MEQAEKGEKIKWNGIKNTDEGTGGGKGYNKDQDR
jgi:hypothetical protein